MYTRSSASRSCCAMRAGGSASSASTTSARGTTTAGSAGRSTRRSMRFCSPRPGKPSPRRCSISSHRMACSSGRSVRPERSACCATVTTARPGSAKRSARSASCRCWADSADAAVPAAVRVRPALGGASARRALSRRPEPRRGVHFPGRAGGHAAPMTLARRRRWARYATISLLGSLVGSLIGYALGHFAFDLVRPLFADLGWLAKLDELVAQLRASLAADPWKAFWMLVLAGFLPIPLKIFTWASGIVGLPLPAFVAGMLIGRGKRVYLLCGAIRLGGARVERALHRWIEWIGWGLLVVVVALILYFRFLR